MASTIKRIATVGWKIGLEEVIYQLDGLYDRYHEARYRVSPYLRDRVSIL